MSDIAQFVASVLKDMALSELLDENERLREKLSVKKGSNCTNHGTKWYTHLRRRESR